MNRKLPKSERIIPVTPPFLEEETKSFGNKYSSFSGTACEHIVKAHFLSKNINTTTPDVDDGVDLLIQKPEGWVRGQVKKITYKLDLDYKHKREFGNEIYRSRFVFSFQPKRSTGQLNKQRTPSEIDYFYHVLSTPYRQLIWETPTNIIPLRKDGTFVESKNVVLDRNNFTRGDAEIDLRKFIISAKYDSRIFEEYPDFFSPNKNLTLFDFFV